ncbi:hypothetical protein CJ191_01235 [Aerococcus viridans]|uniref:DUF1642 domain-containing protein n=1 Tax=Aerococcus viridans TaxID=1377 RepID=A0A2N6UFQ9_9LACT|nr:DUF1642 domain-containing protein [Aerococcus viridans]PMC80459.1 hypothetical protein CJ191_01235 [Aerococcus viridans]
MKIEIDKPVVPKWFDDWYKDVPTEQDGYGATKEEHAIQLVSQVGWGNGLYKSMSNFEREHDEERVGYVLDNKTKLFHAILFGYEVEKEPLYYAKIKGWELSKGNIYWNANVREKSLFIQGKSQVGIFKTKLTKYEWNELGINDTNADFE